MLVPSGFKGGIANMGYLTGKIDNPATMIHEKHFNSPFDIQKQLDRVSKLPEFVMLPAMKLPDGEYKILGKAKDLTEKQCQAIIPLPAITAKYGDPYQYSPAKDSLNIILYQSGCYVLGEDNKRPAGTWLILQKL